MPEESISNDGPYCRFQVKHGCDGHDSDHQLTLPENAQHRMETAPPSSLNQHHFYYVFKRPVKKDLPAIAQSCQKQFTRIQFMKSLSEFVYSVKVISTKQTITTSASADESCLTNLILPSNTATCRTAKRNPGRSDKHALSHQTSSQAVSASSPSYPEIFIAELELFLASSPLAFFSLMHISRQKWAVFC